MHICRKMHSLVQTLYRKVIQLISPCMLYIHVFIISFVGPTHTCKVLMYLEKEDLVSRWRRIGLLLEVTHNDLDIIEKDRAREEDRTTDMLHRWLTSGRATKQALVDAVQVIK